MLDVMYRVCQCNYMLFLGTSYLFLEWDISHSGGPRPCQHCNSRAACWAEQREGAYTAFLHWQAGSRALSLLWPWDYQLQQKGKEDARVYMRNKTKKHQRSSITRLKEKKINLICTIIRATERSNILQYSLWIMSKVKMMQHKIAKPIYLRTKASVIIRGCHAPTKQLEDSLLSHAEALKRKLKAGEQQKYRTLTDLTHTANIHIMTPCLIKVQKNNFLVSIFSSMRH